MTSRAIRDAISRTLTPEEVREALEEPISDAERTEVESLIRWFTTRYPSAEERLAYVRQAYARWRSDVDRTGLR